MCTYPQIIIVQSWFKNTKSFHEDLTDLQMHIDAFLNLNRLKFLSTYIKKSISAETNSSEELL